MAMIIAGMVALATLIATIFKPARLAMLLGELLGLLLKWLGFGLALAGGAAAAGAAGSADQGSRSADDAKRSPGRKPGGPDTPSAGGPVTMPVPGGVPIGGGQITIPVPVPVPVPGATLPATTPARPSATRPPPTTKIVPPARPPLAPGDAKTAPRKITVPRPDEIPSVSGKPSTKSGSSFATSSTASSTKASTTESKTPGKASGSGQTIELALIEGLNLDTVSEGQFTFVWLNYGKTSNVFMLLQASKVSRGKETTAEFRSMLECNSRACLWTGNKYRVTHPYKPSSNLPPLIGQAALKLMTDRDALIGHLEAIAETLDQQQRSTEASLVRSEIQRVRLARRSVVVGQTRQ